MWWGVGVATYLYLEMEGCRMKVAFRKELSFSYLSCCKKQDAGCMYVQSELYPPEQIKKLEVMLMGPYHDVLPSQLDKPKHAIFILCLLCFKSQF